MFKKFLVVVLAVTLVLTTMVGCGNSSSTSSEQKDNKEPAAAADAATSTAPTPEKPMVMKLSHVFLNTQPMHIALAEVAKNIEERTDGAIKIEVYDNGQIPSGVDGVEQCIRGAEYINVYDAGAMGDWVPDYKALVGPMLFDTRQEFSEFCEGEFVSGLNAQAEENGIKVLALDYTFGFRNVGTSQKPILSLEDMKGLKIRVPKSSVWVETFKGFGASPSAMGWGEIYNALQTNMIDAMESSTFDIYDSQFYEVLDHVTTTKHFLGTSAVMMSKKVFDSLSPEQQQIFQEEFAKGAIKNNELSDEAGAGARKAMEEKGVKFHDIDLTEFKEASRAYYDNMPGLSPNVYDTMMKELNVIRGK